MRKDLLLKLADLLEADAANDNGMVFDLRYLGEWKGPMPQQTLFPKFEVSCNTMGCAMGLAAISGAFQEDGLGFTVSEESKDWYTIVTTLHGDLRSYSDAAMDLFEIPERIAYAFFSPEWYTGRVFGSEGELRVAKRIRRYVKSDGRYIPDMND